MSDTKNAMIDEDVLAGMLAELAETITAPPLGAQQALQQARRADAGLLDARMKIDRLSRARRIGLVAAAAAIAVVGAVAIHGHGGQGSSSTGSSAASSLASGGASSTTSSLASGGAARPAAGAAAGGGTTTGSTTGTRNSPGGASVPPVDADRVVRTGDVSIVVPRGQSPATVTQLAAAAGGLGGYLQDSDIQQADPRTGEAPTATATLRVPAAQFEALLARAQALGTVVSSTTTGKDVTASYVDLAARLKALETSRGTYLVILSKAATVNDTLAVQQRLDDLQTQIEQLQGQQNELAAQSALATLSVEVAERGGGAQAAPTARRTGLGAALHTAGDRFRRGSEAVIAASGTLALIALFGLLAAGIIRFGTRRYRRRMA